MQAVIKASINKKEGEGGEEAGGIDLPNVIDCGPLFRLGVPLAMAMHVEMDGLPRREPQSREQGRQQHDHG